MQIVYVILFPPSLGLMAADSAGWLEQALLAGIAVAANGLCYALAARAGRKYR